MKTKIESFFTIPNRNKAGQSMSAIFALQNDDGSSVDGIRVGQVMGAIFALKGRNVNNRRWSERVARTEPADRCSHSLGALQGRDSCISQGHGKSRPFRAVNPTITQSAGSAMLHRRLFTLRPFRAAPARISFADKNLSLKLFCALLCSFLAKPKIIKNLPLNFFRGQNQNLTIFH
jgi:hypothetical protein